MSRMLAEVPAMRRTLRAELRTIRFVLAAVICAGWLCGCASTPPPKEAVLEELPGVRGDAKTEAIRVGVNEYVVTFTAAVRRASDEIIERTDDHGVRRNALLWKLNVIPMMRQACFRGDPMAALFDAWALAAQMHRFFTDGAGAAAFGLEQRIAVETSEEMLATVRELWRGVSDGDEAMQEWEETRLTPWVEANPIADLSFARGSSIAPYSDFAKDRGGTFQRVKNLDEEVALLSRQLRVYFAGLHHQVRGEVELALHQVIDPMHLETVVRSAERASLAAEVLPDAIEDARAATVDEFRKIVDTAFLRIIGLLVAAIVLAPIIAHVYVRVWPQSAKRTG